MKIVVGLGNPGEKYKNTRHNVGFLVVDELMKIYGPIDSSSVVLVKPDKFMNNSGVVVKKYVKNFPGDIKTDLIVIHDDLDIKLGEYKISEKGPKTHNGLKSIYEQVGKDFVHVRIGVDARHSPGKASKENQRLKGIRPSGIGISGKDYVLGNWKPEEKELLEGVISRVVREIKNALA